MSTTEIISGNKTALATAGAMVELVIPATPVLSIVISGTSAVITITGDADATHYLKYKKSSDASWQSGGSCSGNGTITVTGLSVDVPYIFIAYSRIGSSSWSLPAVACTVTLAVSTANEFDEQITQDADIFLDMFAETIHYYPGGGGSRTIRAIIDREGARGMDGMPYGNASITSIIVANRTTDGISSSEIDPGKDKVELSIRTGETAQQRIITKILSQDVGMMTLEVR